MWEESNLADKKFNAETHKLIGENQLHKFGLFLDEFSYRIGNLENKFSNKYHVSSRLILLDERVIKSESVFFLTHSDNKNLAKILACLVGICNEMIILIEEAEAMFPKFLVLEDNDEMTLKYLSVSKIIEALQKAHLYVKRVQEVLILTLRQICALLGRKPTATTSSCLFPEVLNNLGCLLLCVLKLDYLLDANISKEHWFLFRKTIRNSLHSCKTSFSRNQLRSLDKTLLTFETELLMGTILKRTIEKILDDKKFYFELKNCSFKHELMLYINSLMSELEKDDDFNPNVWIIMNIFMAVYCYLFGCTDKKLIKKLLDLNKTFSACTLIGNIMWYAEQFILKHVPSINKFIDEKAIEGHRLTLVNKKSSSFPRDTNVISSQACLFLIELKKISRLNMSNLTVKELHSVIGLFNRGIKLSRKINFLLKWMLNINADKNLPVTKSVVISVCKLVETLEGIYNIYRENSIKVAYILLLILQHLSHKAVATLHTVRKNFTQEKSYKEYQLDVLSAFNLCEQVLKGPCTNQSLLIANLALSSSGLSSATLTEIRSILKQLEMMMNFSTSLREMCNCSFIYWHQNYILPIYFSKLISNKANVCRHFMMLNALGDNAILCTTDNSITNKLIDEHLYKPMEQLIEVNLRLQTHLHLQLPHVDPFQNYFSINFRKLLPILMSNVYKSIKNEVEHHLSMVFYNLTSVVLHDWQTYGEMRKLAYVEYGLDTVDDNLPMQSLEQGLDVLQIMRNINTFVNKYLYNLNSQIFIEKESNNKHLNSINISHVANSIRTHGVGIMNTTVNFTYQFLRSQFQTFSQFLFDEHIKSRLIKDIKFFTDQKNELNQMYPYKKAEKFNLGIKKLGLNEKGDSYLDLFRKVITNIGNAMGYVRLIRSGGKRCLAEGTCFIPDMGKVSLIEDLLESEEMPDVTKNAMSKFHRNLQMFMDNIDDATEYYRLLVKVFEPVLRNKKNLHLKNFFVIVPPLTVNFVEYSLNCKEKLNKKNDECPFTDDGFALGLAYIIKILDQELQLNSLHWFHSVQRKFKIDRENIEQQMKNTDNDTKLNQALTLTDKKFSIYETEFQLLYYNFNSARLFFQS